MPPVLNPSAAIFAPTTGAAYVDKTALIAYTNSVMATADHFTALPRPPRFGKTTTARMLAAFYSKGADTRAFFERCRIAQDGTPDLNTAFRRALLEPVPWDVYLNRCNVLFWDFTEYADDTNLMRQTADLCRAVRSQFFQTNSGVTEFPQLLGDVYQNTGELFYLIIDNWDAPFLQPSAHPTLLREWLMLLRLLFATAPADSYLQGALITGVLPPESCPVDHCLENFWDVNQQMGGRFAEFVGFTKSETARLCEGRDIRPRDLAQRFGGLHFSGAVDLINPGYVTETLAGGTVLSSDATADLAKLFPKLLQPNTFTELQSVLKGLPVKIYPREFKADPSRIRDNADEILTLCIYFGLLDYTPDTSTVRVPNSLAAESLASLLHYFKSN